MTFTVVCHPCGRTVLTAVRSLESVEISALLQHLRSCERRPPAEWMPKEDELGHVLRFFDVHTRS